MKKNKLIILYAIIGISIGSIRADYVYAQSENTEEDIWYIWNNSTPAGGDISEESFEGAFDDADFQPNMIPYLVDEQSSAKGNILICSGGGDKLRNNDYEGIPACEFYNSIGYNAYLVNYRVAPYESVDATLDLQRAVRYLRYYGEEYGIGAIDKVATMGFSAGAMHCYAQALAFGGEVTADKIYPDYICDEIDAESADVTAVLAVYAAGMPHDGKGITIDVKEPILSIEDVGEDAGENLPAFFFAGAAGHFASGFCVKAFQELNPLTICELHMYGGVERPFGMGEEFIGSDQMKLQIEAFLDVRFGYVEQEKEMDK